MTYQAAIDEFKLSAISGVSKEQLIRFYQDEYNFTDDNIAAIIKESEFRKKPLFVNYFQLYNLKIPTTAKKLKYPFTQIYLQENFLEEDHCQEIMEEMEQHLHPSYVSNVEDRLVVSEYRTSSSADFDYKYTRLGTDLDFKISRYLKIDPFLGESIQGQKYKPGEFYKEHHDWYTPFTPEYKTYTEWMGQRSWTFMIYLNEVEEGGETYFKHLNLKVKPKPGLAIFWNNLYINGWPNYKTLHEALPPVSGDKYIITKWFRSWPML